MISSGLRLGALLNHPVHGWVTCYSKQSSPEGPRCWDGKPRPMLQGKVGSDKVPCVKVVCLCLSLYSGPISSSKGSPVQLAGPQSIIEQFGFMQQMYYQMLQSPESVIHFWERVPVLEFKMLQNLRPWGLAPRPYLQTPKSNKQMSKNKKKKTLAHTQDQIINGGRRQNCLHKTVISWGGIFIKMVSRESTNFKITYSVIRIMLLKICTR